MLPVLSRKHRVPVSVNYKRMSIDFLSVFAHSMLNSTIGFKHHTDDLSWHTQEAFDTFRESIARHLEQLFGSVPVQIEGLT